MISISLNQLSKQNAIFTFSDRFYTHFDEIRQQRLPTSLRYITELHIDPQSLKPDPNVVSILQEIYNTCTLTSNTITLSQYINLHYILSSVLAPSLTREYIATAARSDYSIDRSSTTKPMTCFEFIESMYYLVIARCPPNVTFLEFSREILTFITSSPSSPQCQRLQSSLRNPSAQLIAGEGTKFRTFHQFIKNNNSIPLPLSQVSPSFDSWKPSPRQHGQKSRFQGQKSGKVSKSRREVKRSQGGSRQLSSPLLVLPSSCKHLDLDQFKETPTGTYFKQSTSKAFTPSVIKSLSQPKFNPKLPTLSVEEVFGRINGFRRK
ncbi:hypothetical protein P9112_014617 [Eukaryota sp. TZLM1-RC]